MGTELLLWLLLILPGMLYSLWRHTARYKGCPTCAEPRMIPLDSPAGGQLQDRFGREGSGGD
jgi:hypothetical protein